MVMKVMYTLLVVVALLVCPTKAGTSALFWAEALREYNNKQSSVYTHTTFVNETAGIYQYDCNGFVGYALTRISPPAYAAIPSGLNFRPLSEDFAAYFASLTPESTGYWAGINNVTDLMPGDVIAWIKPAGSDKNNTGHTMIVAERGYWDTRKTRRGHWVIRVMDSSYYYHALDTRVSPINGLGMGTIALVVNTSTNSLAPVGYRWKGGVASTLYYTTVGLGRPNILPTVAPTRRATNLRPSKRPTPTPTLKPTKKPKPAPSRKPTKQTTPRPTRSTRSPTRTPKPTSSLWVLNTTSIDDISNGAVPRGGRSVAIAPLLLTFVVALALS